MMDKQCVDEKFINYHVKLRSLISNQQFEDFKILKSNRDKVLFIVNLKDRPRYPITSEKYRGKNLKEAKSLKDQGNIHFCNENYGEAFAFYSQSILKSSRDMPEFAEELPIFYANRSAALYYVKKYDLCINDIDFALKIGYPSELSYKLADRKARCLLALGKYNLACDVFKQTVTALDEAKLPIERRQKWQKDIQIMLAMMNKNRSRTTVNHKSTICEKPHGSKMKVKTNPKYEGIISAIEIKSTEKLGRFGEAKHDIKAGEIILIEDAHCSVLLEKFRNTNCHRCFKRVEALHGCPTCDQVIFCSVECTNVALSTFHKIECPILRTLWKSEISVTCLMALRIITQKELRYFCKKRLILSNSQFRSFPKFTSSMYESVFNLVTHENKRTPENLLNRAFMAVFLLDCLKQTSYFTQEDENIENGDVTGPPSENEIYIAELLLHNLQVLQFNAHEVSEIQVHNNDIETASSEFIGGALYPTLALFNHSCNPHVMRYFEGTKVIAVTIRHVKAGEMIGENYGPLFTEIQKKERQRILNEQYWFECACEACEFEWPTIAQMNNLSDIKLRCTNNKCSRPISIDPNANHFLVKCASCSQLINMFKPLKALQETDGKFALARSLLKINKSKKALEEFLKLLHVLDESLVPPYKDYYLCLQGIRTCFLLMGNMHMDNSKL